MPLYTIRKVDGSKRAEVIVALASECGFITSELPDPTVGDWWLVYHQGEPVGFAGMRPAVTDPEAAFLCLAGVLASHRGKGLQRKLVRKRLELAKQEGYARVISHTMTWNVHSSNNLVREGFELYWPAVRFGGAADVNYWTKGLRA